jgi:peptidoglycan/xylan/chitin deacetylase (PgdA/CDA1 family)
MTATCIISFDCEGKWGMADKITPELESVLTSSNLELAYTDILRVLDESNIKATFAFVGAFTLSKDEFIDNWLRKILLSQQHCEWLNKLIEDIKLGIVDGWFLPDLLDIVNKSSVGHEIASHGFTHLPLTTANSESVQIELDGILFWKKKYLLNADTFVFPRNAVSADLKLRDVGIFAYRDAPSWGGISGFKGRIFNLLREFYPFVKSQTMTPSNFHDIVKIPGDFFLNWRSGLRKLVPKWLTLYRLKSAIDDSICADGIVHLWLHPHNLITGFQQKELFEDCILLIKKYVDSGSVVVKTQSEFYNSLPIK